MWVGGGTYEVRRVKPPWPRLNGPPAQSGCIADKAKKWMGTVRCPRKPKTGTRGRRDSPTRRVAKAG